MSLIDIFDERRCCMNCKYGKHFSLDSRAISCANPSSGVYEEEVADDFKCNHHKDRDGYDSLFRR